MNDIDGADSAFDRAERLAPQCAADLRENRRRLWVPLLNGAVDKIKAGDNAAAIAQLQRANHIFDAEPPGFYYLGQLYANMQQRDSAIFYFERALTLATNDLNRNDATYAEIRTNAAFNVARLFHMEEQYDSAVVWYGRVREVRPTDPQALTGMATGLDLGAFVSAMGSAGTIAAGEALKRWFPGSATVAVEPIQCPTLYNVGFGSRRIEGIGDKHVTWIHNVWATDLLVCVDDQECLEGLQLLQEGTSVLEREGLDPALARSLVDGFGISGVCNLLAAIKAARYYGLGSRQAVVTVATDGFDRYPSVLRRLDRERGRMTEDEARRRLGIFRGQKIDHVVEGTQLARRRSHNQKYFTWVEPPPFLVNNPCGLNIRSNVNKTRPTTC